MALTGGDEEQELEPFIDAAILSGGTGAPIRHHYTQVLSVVGRYVFARAYTNECDPRAPARERSFVWDAELGRRVDLDAEAARVPKLVTRVRDRLGGTPSLTAHLARPAEDEHFVLGYVFANTVDRLGFVSLAAPLEVETETVMPAWLAATPTVEARLRDFATANPELMISGYSVVDR